MASTRLTKVFGTSGNRIKWTWSSWIKRGNLGNTNRIFGVYQNVSYNTTCYLSGANGQLAFIDTYNGSEQAKAVTNAYHRDVNGWYHIVVTYDRDNATSADKLILYVNGERVSLSTYTAPTQATTWNVDGLTMEIGAFNSLDYFDGSMSHIHFCDGYAYSASDFGETDANGVWKIKTEPSVTYGTNGFFILKDGNSVTDQSGNGNNFTVGGGTLTNTEDSPSNVFATYNPLDIKAGESNIYVNGNTTLQVQTSGGAGSRSTLAVTSGKYYAEFKHNTVGSDWTGVAPYERPAEDANTSSESVLIYSNTGSGWTAYVNGVSQGSGGIKNSFSSGEILMLALDMDNDLVYVGVDGGWFNGTDCSGTSPSNGFSLTANRTYAFKTLSGSTATNVNANFGNGYFGTTAVASAGTNASGNGIFEYDVPTGYTALSTKGLNT